jgi:hypothetical protein
MRVRVIITSLLLALAVMSLVACGGEGTRSGDEQIEQAVNGRWKNFDRASQKYPDPQLQNFPLRNVLLEMTLRQDMVNHPWYIYLFGQNGNMIGHYVGTTVPINACNFLSSSEDIYQDNEGGNMPVQAPSLDGMYYGTATCDAWVFIDAASNSLVQIRGMAFHASEAPMILDAEAQKFVVEDVEE